MYSISLFLSSLLRPTLLGIVLVLSAFSSPAANRTWDGGDLDLPGFWSARTNWNGNTNIVTGDALFFPGTATVKTMNNNLSISNFAKLTFNDDGYTLNGNSLRLTNGIAANYVPTGPTRINVGITLGDDAAFEADDSSATLELNGPVNVLGFVLTNQGVGNITWLAPFRSTAGGIVRKRETGTVTVRSTNANFLGTVEISGGDFNVNGRMTAGAITVNNGGTLGGTGLVNAVTVNNSGIIAPGGGRAVLNVTGGLTLRARGIYEAEVLGATAGLFDQLNVQGSVNLSNAALTLTVNFIPASPTAITIIANDGVDAVLGTFAGLPQGAVVLVTDFIRATISYTGGTGNDVVITVSPLETLTWTGSTSGFWSVGANWVGGVAPQSGDSLVFPVVAVRKQATNDFVADTVFGLIRYETNFTLVGARAALRRGFHSFSSGPASGLHLPLKLADHQTFTNQFQDLRYLGGIELGGFGLTFRSGTEGAEHLVHSEISGPGTITQAGVGSLLLDASNSFDGVLVALDSVLVGHPHALGSAAQATLVATNGSVVVTQLPPESVIDEPINLGGLLHVSSATNLAWSGNITFDSPLARISVDTNLLFTLTSATLGAHGFVKDGSGTLRLATIQASHGGTTFVKAGTLQVDTALTNSTLVVSNGATLTGAGTVRQATFLAGSILSPAGEAGGGSTVSTLTVTQSLTLQGDARLRVNLNGTGVANYDQLDVLGTVNLGAGTAILDVQLGFEPVEGQSFAILDNDGAEAITGTFAGKPPGAIFTVNGQRLQISYTGGTGNDITLTVLGPEELTWTGTGGNGLWGTPGNWNLGRIPLDGDRLIFPGGTPRRFVTNNIGDLDLHSLRFAGAGASNNNFQVFGSTPFIGNGIVVTNPVSAEFKMQVALTASQTLVVRGLLAFDDVLNAPQGVAVVGNSTFRAEQLLGGPYHGAGGTWELTGFTSINSGQILGLSNVILNYAALRVTPTPLHLTNSTFRLNATSASVSWLLLTNSLLDVASANFATPDLLLRCGGDLEFLGASRLAFDFQPSHRPIVEVTGNVRLNNAILVVSNINVAFGVPVTVIRNRGGNPVNGIFNGLPESATLTDANGVQHRISYFGGASGDDVTLTRVAPVTGLTRVWRGQAANGDWSQPANWVANLVPADGDSVEFPDAPKPINTNNLPTVRYNQLRFTGTSGVARVLAPNTNSLVGLQLLGGLDYRDTGTLRIPVTNTGFLNPRGLVQILAPQDFHVATGGTVTVDALIGLPGAVVTKTGGGILEVGATAAFFGAVAVPLRVREGTLRVGDYATASLEQTGGTLDVLRGAGDVTLFGGHFQTGPINVAPENGATLFSLDASGATNAVIIRPGGEGAVGSIFVLGPEDANGNHPVTESITLQSNVTLRLDVATPIGQNGSLVGFNDRLDLAGYGSFRPNGARLELNFLPSFNPSPTNLLLLILSQNARTNLGTFAGLPHLGLLTNEFGLFRIYYRDFVLLPPFNIFGNSTNHDSVILERIIARPVMLTVTNGPGAFKTVTALGTPGAFYVIEGSEDLENWTPLSGETANATTGRISFTDVSGLPYRFYRAALP